MNNKTYSTIEITKALQIKKERLRVWIDEGFVSPSIQKGIGPGTKHIFSVQDVYMVSLFHSLIEYGFSRESADIFLKSLTAALNKDKPLIIDYIIFRSSSADGKEVINLVDYLLPGEWKFDIETGYIDWSLSNPVFKKYVDESEPRKGKKKNWRSIHIINFKDIRNEVDSALAKL